MEPVKKTEAPGYYQVIRFPMGMYACSPLTCKQTGVKLRMKCVSQKQYNLKTPPPPPIQTLRQWASAWRAGTTQRGSCSWPTCSASSPTVGNITPRRASTTSVPTCWRNSSTPRSKKRASSRSSREGGSVSTPFRKDGLGLRAVEVWVQFMQKTAPCMETMSRTTDSGADRFQKHISSCKRCK